ncbi:hypothetical protein IP91_02619 [Pseudoduganella lurida]|uniref:CBM-cenC domain-containing protein n=2 Tax=Pseudoduganella lurida TaxID=1036180 RepID=A0A562R818_9BURK|nr:hypothetical protein IP91_02619 [Pseudoduganella lurida]
MDGVTYQKYQAMLPHAKAAGFNAVALSASGTSAYIGLLDHRWSDRYRATLKQRLVDAVRKANEAGLEVVPVAGNPESPQYLQASLTEAFPTTTPYVVKGGRAAPANGAVNLLGNGDFEAAQLTPWGVDMLDALAAGGGQLDDDVAHNGKRSLRLEAKVRGGGPALSRLIQQVKLRPNTAYRLSFWLKSGSYANPGALRLLIMGSGANKEALYAHADHNLGWGVTDGTWNAYSNTATFRANQPWTLYNVQFNSGTKEAAGIYLGTWGRAPGPGTVWVDDMELREIGISMPIERDDGRDYVVQAKDGSTTYRRGTDYEIDGEQLSIRGNSIPEGAELNVSWRQSAEHIFASSAPAIACENGDYFTWQKKLYDAIDPVFGHQPSAVITGSKRKYFMYYDEIRVMNWETWKPGCSMPSAAEYLRRMVTGVQARLPKDLETAVWNDMFDPSMNGVPQYYQVRGSLHRSQKDMYDRNPGTVIINWTGGSETDAGAATKRRASLKFFRNQPQVVALYYDAIDSTDAWLKTVVDAQAADPALKIDGLMYTTWNNKYMDLDEVARRIRASPLGRRWPVSR